MPTRKIMAPKRKTKKKYPMVEFEVDGFDGAFTLPKVDAIPLSIAVALERNNLGKLLDFLAENAPGCAEIVNDLSADEFQGFMDAWGKASGVEPGK